MTIEEVMLCRCHSRTAVVVPGAAVLRLLPHHNGELDMRHGPRTELGHCRGWVPGERQGEWYRQQTKTPIHWRYCRLYPDPLADVTDSRLDASATGTGPRGAARHQYSMLSGTTYAAPCGMMLATRNPSGHDFLVVGLVVNPLQSMPSSAGVVVCNTAAHHAGTTFILSSIHTTGPPLFQSM